MVAVLLARQLLCFLMLTVHFVRLIFTGAVPWFWDLFVQQQHRTARNFPLHHLSRAPVNNFHGHSNRGGCSVGLVGVSRETV